MKLINKTQRIYSILIVGALILWSGIFLFAIYSAIEENIDESLRSELTVQAKRLRTKQTIPAITTPQMTISPIRATRDTAVSMSDTTIFNSVEKEDFPYRQAKTQVQIAGQAYQLTMRRSMVEYDDLFETILLMELIFVLLLLGGLYVINRNILQRLWSPFYRTLQQVTQYNIDQPEDLNLEETDIEEFQKLNGVLQTMIRQIEQEYRSLKQFTENASHEIQTPLSVITNKTEMLLQDKNLSSKQAEKIAAIRKTTGRLSRLNKALLMLTKIENRQYSNQQEIDISQLLLDLLPDYKALAQAKNINVEKKIRQGINLQINKELAELMLRNLLANAVKHNVEDGHIKLTLTEDSFTIENTGDTDVTKPVEFFERFKKGRQSQDSLGLGLSIVSAIATTNNFELEYSIDQGTHTLILNF